MAQDPWEAKVLGPTAYEIHKGDPIWCVLGPMLDTDISNPDTEIDFSFPPVFVSFLFYFKIKAGLMLELVRSLGFL